MIKPIETVYNGYRFRSRLEARWAVLFDGIGIRYRYEPEGFALDDGTLYLPDFQVYIPQESRQGALSNLPASLYVEVKGEIPIPAEDWHKVESLAEITNGTPSNPIYVVGDIPLVRNAWDIIEMEKDRRFDRRLYSLGLVTGEDRGAKFCTYQGKPALLPDGQVFDDGTIAAYQAARMARFEHGETPQTKATAS
jgi:hypothetical protein